MSKTIKIVTPDNVEIEYTLASVGVRAAAAGIDLLIHGAVILIVAIIATFILLSNEADEGTIYSTIAIMFLIYGLLNYAYYILCDLLMKGQTFGKKVYKIRIIRDNGEGITVAHAMIREFIRATIDPLGIGFILILFSKKNKRLGDMAASTIVVEEEKMTLSYLDLSYNTLGKYDLSKEEIMLLQDYFSRKEMMEEGSRKNLQKKLVQYFVKKLDIQNIVEDGDGFLKSILQ
ncbi:MAG: hypothetical protein CVV02_04225 [Firmicutes bacterium HGW-Firmicutes-7]|nr:MAG: hypothetical protein CVV02_04225 [Firmicutes bacterium HGW-Firmicutes-7]